MRFLVNVSGAFVVGCHRDDDVASRTQGVVKCARLHGIIQSGTPLQRTHSNWNQRSDVLLQLLPLVHHNLGLE